MRFCDLQMERDCLLAHGVSGFMLDRLKDCSDATGVHICGKCGFVADRPDWCGYCAEKKKIEHVSVPHSLLLLKRELEGMHIGMCFQLQTSSSSSSSASYSSSSSPLGGGK